MLRQRTKPNQQQACRNNEQNQINNRHIGTMSKTESTADMRQKPTDTPLILQQPTDTPQQTGCRSE
jgi:hypothetical protein